MSEQSKHQKYKLQLWKVYVLFSSMFVIHSISIKKTKEVSYIIRYSLCSFLFKIISNFSFFSFFYPKSLFYLYFSYLILRIRSDFHSILSVIKQNLAFLFLLHFICFAKITSITKENLARKENKRTNS